MLSKSFQVADHGGLSNLLIDPREWKSNLCKLPSSGLDFLPAGTSHWEHWGSETRLRQLAVELRCRYQFVCVAASDPQDPNSRVWTSVCDGSFLLVSLKNANQLIAQSAVVELQSNGARLLGCVVTDADAMLP
jgi:Mrp family chromosome partitioning ATPase